MEEKTKHYFNTLPEGYAEDYAIDAKATPTVLLLNIIGVIALLGIVIGLFFARGLLIRDLTSSLIPTLISLAAFFGVYVIYIVLHELTHGVAYKFFTKEKLKFGMSFTVADCGVPTIYLKKKAAYIATLAPFVVYSILFAILVALTYVYAPPYIYFASIFLFASHVSGCIGDLYVTFVLLFRYTGKPVLVNDTGPKQSFYLPKEKKESEESL